jgi:L-serine dehydratase
MAQVTAANEQHWRSADEVQRQLLRIWQTMAGAVQRGCAATGTCPAPCMCAAARPSCTAT